MDSASIHSDGVVTSTQGAGAGRHRRQNSRYRPKQRFTAVTWSLLLIIIAASVLAYYRSSTERPDATDRAPSPAPSASDFSAQGTLTAWLTESGPAIDGLVAARNRIAAAAADNDIATTGDACLSASSLVENLRQHLPSPEPVLNSTLRRAVDSYGEGLPHCVSATRTRDGQGMQRAARYIAQGDIAMQAALNILGRGFGAQSRLIVL